MSENQCIQGRYLRYVGRVEGLGESLQEVIQMMTRMNRLLIVCVLSGVLLAPMAASAGGDIPVCKEEVSSGQVKQWLGNIDVDALRKDPLTAAVPLSTWRPEHTYEARGSIFACPGGKLLRVSIIDGRLESVLFPDFLHYHASVRINPDKSSTHSLLSEVFGQAIATVDPEVSGGDCDTFYPTDTVVPYVWKATKEKTMQKRDETIARYNFGDKQIDLKSSFWAQQIGVISSPPCRQTYLAKVEADMRHVMAVVGVTDIPYDDGSTSEKVIRLETMGLLAADHLSGWIGVEQVPGNPEEMEGHVDLEMGKRWFGVRKLELEIIPGPPPQIIVLDQEWVGGPPIQTPGFDYTLLP